LWLSDVLAPQLLFSDGYGLFWTLKTLSTQKFSSDSGTSVKETYDEIRILDFEIL
jgi:hypothetical protein